MDETNLRIQCLIDEEYTRHPFYGTRRMGVYLGRHGFVVNRKRVQRLMREMGLAGMGPGPQTSRPHLTTVRLNNLWVKLGWISGHRLKELFTNAVVSSMFCFVIGVTPVRTA